METYPKSQLLVINSWIVIITWFFLAVFFISLFLLFILAIGEAFFGLFAFLGMVVFGAIHIFLSFKLKCSNCNKMVTVQGFATVHNKSRKSKYLNAWSSVVLDVLIKREFICIHCGTEYAVGTENNL
jgi:hypothetical protein